MTPSRTDPPLDVWKVEDLARYLRVDRKTAYQAIERGDIPGVRRVGRAIRINRAAVETWFSSDRSRR